MRKRATTAIMVAAAGITVACGLTVAAASDGGSGKAEPITGIGSVSRQLSTATPKPHASEASKPKAAAEAEKKKAPQKTPAKPKKQAAKKKLPSGVSTATSFWDPETASGKPMSYKTLASPYWPLGTKVKITYGGKSAIGVVEDFGPAEWAVAQHSPPAIIDLSEKMMADLTGTRSNSVPVKFQVLDMGSGRSYVHGGTGYDLAMGTQNTDR
jgi:Lytic transglycolase